MDPRAPWPLLWGSLFALPTAVLTPVCLPAAALIAAVGFLFAIRRRHRHALAGLCALPALLAALPAPGRPPQWPRPGPVAVQGAVAAVIHAPQTGDTVVVLRGGGPPVRLRCAGTVEVLPGDRITATARLAAAAAPDLPPTLHVARNGLVVHPGCWSLQRACAAARRALERELLRLVPGEIGALLAALVLGRSTRVEGDLVAAHQATGLSHLLAVSGAHAAMLAWLLGLGGGRARRLAAGRTRTLVALVLLFAYAGITGGEPPVLRAVVTFALGALAAHLGRPFTLATGLLVPALVTALIMPDALLGPSFVLSYAAVFGLSLARTSGKGFCARWLWAPLAASFWATLLTAPLTLFWFGQVAPWTVLLTPLLAPLVGVLLCLGLCGALLGCALPTAAEPLGALLGQLGSLYAWAVRSADWLPATPVQACWTPPGWLLLLLLGVAALLVERWPNRRAVAAAVALLVLPWFVPLAGERTDRFCLFAIGHGQAGLLQTKDGQQVAIDCGSLQQPFLAARRLAAALRVRQLDLLVVTHGDQDHHNGVPALLRSASVRNAILPASLSESALADALREHGARLQFLAPGESTNGPPGVRICAPALPDGSSDNDLSLWVTVDAGPVRVLLSGDAEVLGVTAAIAQGIAVPCDVLVLPHHGRANAAAAALLAAVKPVACFASAASADGDTALGDLARRCGADLWVTGQHGDLELRLLDPPTVRASRGERPLRARQ